MGRKLELMRGALHLLDNIDYLLLKWEQGKITDLEARRGIYKELETGVYESLDEYLTEKEKD
jgi:hypothetical protein